MAKTQTLTIVTAIVLCTLSGCSNGSSNMSTKNTRVKGNANISNQSVQNRTNPTSSTERYVATVTLPSSFTSAPDGVPVGLFWASENVMSKHNGYDLSKELGKAVKVYRIDNYFVLKDNNGDIVGNDKPTATFEQITHEKFQQWIEEQQTYSKARLKMSPEDTIKAFYRAVNQHNKTLAWSYTDPFYSYMIMLSSMPHGLPPDPKAQTGISDVVKQIKVLSIKKTPSINPTMHYTVPTKFFKVTTKGVYNQGSVYPSGVNTWVVEMVKPTPKSPWMFDGTPTGGY